jgi:protein LTV1
MSEFQRLPYTTMPLKSIFRQPGAKNFQLVHRSQRDPLIYDPDASEYVLKEFERKNVKVGPLRSVIHQINLLTTYKGTLSSFNDESTDDDDGCAPGEAALYGVYFDDREYDYTQHLRTVGVEESGVDSILIEAPSRQIHKSTKNVFDLIPKEALPSQHEIPRTYDSGQAVEASISGFQPDMDPHLRQTLEALDNDAFVDPAVGDDFFGDLLAEGELGEGEVLSFEFHEDGQQQQSQTEDGADDWQRRFAKFKIEHRDRVDAGSELDGQSEGGDTLGRLCSLSVAGAKRRRRKGASDASGYSMGSSSMFRNEGLTWLDEQFERVSG